MSEIKRPVRVGESNPYPDAPWAVFDAEGRIVVRCSSEALGNEITAALNATPDAGDVEALARWLIDVTERIGRKHYPPDQVVPSGELNSVERASFRDLAAEVRNLIAANEAQLRGALEFIAGARKIAATRALRLVTVRGLFNDVTKAAKRALATPPSEAAQRVRALEKHWKAMRYTELVMGRHPVDRVAYDAAVSVDEEARAELIALDGKDADAFRALDGGASDGR